MPVMRMPTIEEMPNIKRMVSTLYECPVESNKGLRFQLRVRLISGIAAKTEPKAYTAISCPA